jgi:Outer membrane protein beta-barrel family
MQPLLKTGFVCFFVFMVFYNSLAQSTIRGKVINSKKEPAAQASAMLLQAKDSLLVKAGLCDNNGRYMFEDIKEGSYIISISNLGHEPYYTPAFTTGNPGSDLSIDSIVLVEEAKTLTAVTIVSRKPLLEQRIDRLIINVASGVTTAGNTILEVLERSPGVIVNRQDNTIAMNGKDGVNIMINGKLNYMPVSAVVEMLSGMSSNNVEKIELITSPPANFDAEGNAGYINIVLKRNDNYGTNGAFSLTLGYGSGWVTGATINLNHRKEKVNIYTDISYSRVKQPLDGEAYNRISNGGTIREPISDLNRVDTTPNINARLGIDIELSKRTIFGVLLSGYDNRYSQAENNLSQYLTNGKVDTFTKQKNSEVNHWYSYGGNLNLQHLFSTDTKLTLNLDYIHYGNNQPFNYQTDYYDNKEHFVYSKNFRTGKETPINFYVGAMDFSKKLGKNLGMEAGLKQTFSDFLNENSFEKLQQSNWVKIDSLSSRYKLKEDYSAAYVSFDLTIDSKTEAKAGMRYEHTNSMLSDGSPKLIVDRHYGNFFPSVFITRRLNENMAVDLSFTRRITRPTFNDLAPFTYYASDNTFLSGNPALQPAISTAVKTGLSLKSYMFNISYTNEKNSIAAFQPHIDSIKNKTTLSAENLINQKTVSAVISVPVEAAKWWIMQYNITGAWVQSNANYENTLISINQFSVNFNASQRFILPKNYSIVLSGFYQSPSLWGIYESKAYGSLDLGIMKKLPKKQGSLTLNAVNVLNTNILRFSSDIPEHNMAADISLRFALPTLKLTYTRNFGRDEVKQKRERSTGAEEEKSRVN